MNFINFFCVLSAIYLSTALEPVDVIDLNKYLGHWYQVYTDVFNNNTFENGAFCATADYGVNKNGTISVLNKARIGSIDGKEYSINGWGKKATNAQFQGELTVSLQGSPFDAPYWIFKVGPENTTEYEYAVVSDPLQLTLFVLARNVTDYYNNYDKEIMEYLSVNGWSSFLNSPIEILQSGCVYF